MFNGKDYYTNKRKNHNLVYKDKQKGKEIAENLLDATKKMAETPVSPYSNYSLSKEGFESLNPTRRGKEELENVRKGADELKSSVYNNSAAYRNLGKR